MFSHKFFPRTYFTDLHFPDPDRVPPGPMGLIPQSLLNKRVPGVRRVKMGHVAMRKIR